MTLYKQTDPRWINEKLGFGKLTIGQAGCTISDIGYIHNLATGEDLNPSQVNSKLKAVKAFDGSLVIWYRVPLAFPELIWKYRDYNYNNFLVLGWINIWPRFPVLVECVLGNGRHWRVFIGNRQCYDPLKGAICSTANYGTLTGSARFAKK